MTRLGRQRHNRGDLNVFARPDTSHGRPGIWMVGLELSRDAVVDESIVHEPLDGLALGTNITHRVPRRSVRGGAHRPDS